ncbi:M20 family metallopeptidase [Granulosicoccus antarcticus]|nr:M20/M25/M40 family metallo-hydrolase [Granulosicoccus antarcticus]
MLSQLSTLVACDTSFPPGDSYADMAEIVINLCRELNATHEFVRIPEPLWASPGVHGPRINLLTTPAIVQEGLPELLIYFHVDTAPAGDGWQRPPFEVTHENGIVYGRGTADMKGTIVAVLDALYRLQQSEVELKYQPILAFCTDEEGGKYPGIRYLAETMELPELLLNLNGSAEKRIWAGCFGSLNYELVCRGKSAHSGTPELGVNAVEEGMAAIQALMNLKPVIEQRCSQMPAAPDASGPLQAHLTITSISGGDKGAAVPGECRIVFNRRYLPEEDERQVYNELQAVIEQALAGSKLLEWSLQEIGHLPPVRDPDGPGTDRWTAARATACNEPIDSFVRYGSTTSSDFGWVQRAGIQHMMLGGLSRPGRNVHGADEHTTEKDLVELSRAIQYFLAADFQPQTSEAVPLAEPTDYTS